LEQGLERYRRRYNRRLRGHTLTINDYSSARKLNPGERLVFSTVAASGDERLARTFEAFGSRNIGPARMMATMLPRVLYLKARGAGSERRGGGSRAVETESA
jgi:hypothetical protein